MRLLACVLTLTLGSRLAFAETFRVTGVFGQAGTPLAAMVDSDDGYRVVRKGDEIGGGAVVEVIPQGIRLERNGEVTLFRLSGKNSETVGTTPGATSTVKMPPREQAVAELRRTERTLNGDREEDWAAVARALRLPEGAIVTEVDHQPVQDAKSVLRRVHEALQREEIPGLTVDGPEGEIRVYVTPADAGMSAGAGETSEDAG